MMKPITMPEQVKLYGDLFGEMMETVDGEEYHFEPAWIRSQDWRVIPVESMARISEADIPRLVSTLNGNGYTNCIALFNEPGYLQSPPVFVSSDPPDEMASCYELSIDIADFQELNGRLGLFRFILSERDRRWAISCNEWYNLFAGKADLIEALLGKSIDQARGEFLDFASVLASGDTHDSLIQISKYYASLQ